MHGNGTSVLPEPDDPGEPWRAVRVSQRAQRGWGYLLLHEAPTDWNQVR